MILLPGDNVGPYRIIERIGQGGMATVYKASQTTLDRFVALKVLHSALAGDQNFLTRFQREARIVAKLVHPNIIPIYDFAEQDGTPYLVLQFVDGSTLKTSLGSGPLPLDRVLTIIRPVANALDYAHSQGVLHRDIKPSNIICANDGKVFLTDFGLAALAETRDATISQNVIIGTPQYVSPEQGRGEPSTEKSDIYSLAVLLYEMLVGRVPFDGDTPMSVIHDHIYASPQAQRRQPGNPGGGRARSAIWACEGSRRTVCLRRRIHSGTRSSVIGSGPSVGTARVNGGTICAGAAATGSAG